MLLGFPRNWYTPKTNEIATNGMTSFWARTPIRVAISLQIKSRRRLEKKTKTRIAKEISETMNSGLEMWHSRRLHILAEVLNNKGKVWPRMGQKVEFADESPVNKRIRKKFTNISTKLGGRFKRRRNRRLPMTVKF